MLQISLKEKIAVVTGATRGIGFEVARSLARCGARVACVGTNAERLNQSVEQIKSEGGDAEAFLCNVADVNAVKEMAKKVLDTYGRVDILVNNAGITRDMLMRRMTDEEWNDVLSVNLNGPFFVTRAFVESMRKSKWGRIVNVSSISGLIGNAGQANYSASKAGLIGFTRTIARELGNRNITVNAVCPGFVETDMTAVLKDVMVQGIKDRTPIGRLGKPEDIANAVLYFVSEEASFVTGQVIAIDGGLAGGLN
ncbi:MAG: 3-oxoacyl-[acyl-carrier-protein] reductase [Planctomycetia bacterium]|nr:3-oxoacyl-[acyl-carrier-protein] reductase [Planctomycetia bacterium]